MSLANSRLAYFARTLAAGTSLASPGKPVTLDVTGSRIICKESTGQFAIRIDQAGEWIPMEVGLSIYLEPGDSFTTLEIADVSGAANSVALYVGTVVVEDDRLNALIDRTVIVQQEQSFAHSQLLHGNLAAGDSTAIPATSGGRQIHSVTVANRSGTSTDIVYIQIVSGGLELVPVRPGETIEYVIGGDANPLQVNNPTGGSVALTISAKYYY